MQIFIQAIKASPHRLPTLFKLSDKAVHILKARLKKKRGIIFIRMHRKHERLNVTHWPCLLSFTEGSTDLQRFWSGSRHFTLSQTVTMMDTNTEVLNVKTILLKLCEIMLFGIYEVWLLSEKKSNTFGYDIVLYPRLGSLVQFGVECAYALPSTVLKHAVRFIGNTEWSYRFLTPQMHKPVNHHLLWQSLQKLKLLLKVFFLYV